MQDNTSQSGSPCSDYRKYSYNCVRVTKDSNIREAYIQVAGNYAQEQMGIEEKNKQVSTKVSSGISEGVLLVKAQKVLSCSCDGRRGPVQERSTPKQIPQSHSASCSEQIQTVPATPL